MTNDFCLKSLFRVIPVLIVIPVWLASDAATASDDQGVSLPPGLQLHYEEYLRRLEPLYFAVSIDGRFASYSFCDSGCVRSGARRSAITACERQSKGVPCKIYAQGDRIVWSEALFESAKKTASETTFRDDSVGYQFSYPKNWTKQTHDSEIKNSRITITDGIGTCIIVAWNPEDNQYAEEMNAIFILQNMARKQNQKTLGKKTSVSALSFGSTTWGGKFDLYSTIRIGEIIGISHQAIHGTYTIIIQCSSISSIFESNKAAFNRIIESFDFHTTTARPFKGQHLSVYWEGYEIHDTTITYDPNATSGELTVVLGENQIPCHGTYDWADGSTLGLWDIKCPGTEIWANGTLQGRASDEGIRGSGFDNKRRKVRFEQILSE